jgi:ABC-type lipoprotein export system ATPase subunit
MAISVLTSETAGLADRGERPALLEVAHLDMVYGDVHALSDVSLRVEEGEWLAIVGSSGSGKSTLLSLLAALDEPTHGTIRFRGVDLAQYPHVDHYRRADVGLVFQLHNLLPHLDAQRNVEIAMFGAGRRRGRAFRWERARELLALVALTEQADRKPPAMSGGERQRVAIARALANDPALILADEPTGSLDPKSVANVMQVFDDLHRVRGSTIVMVTHDREVAARADRTIRLEDGELVAEVP